MWKSLSIKPHWQNLPGAHTEAFLAASSVVKSIGFVTLTPCCWAYTSPVWKFKLISLQVLCYQDQFVVTSKLQFRTKKDPSSIIEATTCIFEDFGAITGQKVHA
jgi:hypothetical protein